MNVDEDNLKTLSSSSSISSSKIQLIKDIGQTLTKNIRSKISFDSEHAVKNPDLLLKIVNENLHHQKYNNLHQAEEHKRLDFLGNNANNDAGITYESLHTSWVDDFVLPIFILTITICGTIIIGIILLFWLKNNISSNKHSAIQSYNKKTMQKSKHPPNETQHILNPTNNEKITHQVIKTNKIINDNRRSPVNEDLNVELKIKNSPPTSPTVPESTPRETNSIPSENIDCPESSTSTSTSKQKLGKTRVASLDDQTIRGHHIKHKKHLSRGHKVSLNDLSLNSYISPITTPSPTLKTHARKFSFSNNQFVQQSNTKNKYGALTGGSSNDNLNQKDNKHDWLLSSVSVDVCCIQPQQQVTESAYNFQFNNAEDIIGYDERTFILSPKIQSIEIRATISDDKENTIPSPISSSNINNNCVHSANRNLTTISTSKINESSSPLKSIESPKLHAMNVNILQNSPNWHDSSSSPTLIPITPSSVSSSSSTITNTTPNAAMGYTRHSRFTFSPKIISEYNTQQITSSPLVSSAGYKYGNYFKFPEVDVFTPPTATANNIPMLNKQTSIDIDDNENITTSPNPLINVNNNNNPILSCNMEQKPTYTVTDTDSESNKIDSKHNLLIDCNAETGEQCRNEGRKASITNDILNKEKEQHKLSLVSRVVRRARLKSISLDSEGARLVEENLCIPVEELVERANSTHHQQDTNQKQTSVFNFSAEDIHSASTENKNDDMFISKRKKNIFNLTLNLSDKDDTLLLDDDYKFNEFYFEYYDYDDDEEEYENTSQSDIYNYRKRRQQSQMQTPKTPTFSQTRHKASSLDSDQSLCYTKTHSNNNLVQHFDDRSNEEYPEQKTLTKSLKASSISVPTTPKRHQQQYLKAKSTKCNRLGNSATTISLIPIERSHVHTFHNKLKSFEENTDDQSPTSHLPNDDSQNSSNANLRTLPELTTANVENCEKPASTIMNKSRSSILQRRGSNHSLTLNLDTSGAGLGCNTSLSRGLSSSNYSLGNYKGSHLSLAGSSYNLPMQQQQIQLPTQKNQLKKNLLQRRGSNASLTLNLQGSVCNLNRFNSHNSLNIQNQQQSRPLTNKKGLLERRNSNASLTLNIQNKALSVSNCNLRGSNCSLNSMMTNQTANYEDSDNHLTVNNQRNYRNRPACKMSLHQPNSNMTCSQQHNQRRKFLSSESLHNISNAGHTGCCHNVPEHYGQLQQNQKNEYGSIDNMQCNESLNNMSGAGAMFAMKSTVTSTSSANNLANFTKCDCCSDCCCNYEDSLASGTGAMNIGSTNVRNITTKPLSPQTTSEDFKIYLANIQFLQNASNILTSKQLKNLNYIFNKSYNNNSQNNALSDYHGSNNDVQLMNIRTDLTKTTEAYRNNFDQKENDLPSEDDQKKMLIKIHQEFWDLPTNYQEKPLVFGSQSKNRYKTILPNEHSRVVLQAETGTITEPYINANFIKGPDYASNSYIATQGPMQNTIYEFWVMIFQNIMKIAASQNMENLHNIDQKLIMLTDFIENTRQKCSVYFPQQIDDVTVFTNSTEHTQLIYDNANYIYNNVPNDILNIKCNYFLVKNVGICQKNGYSKRKLHVIHFCQEATTDTFKSFSFMVYHYWFPDWPDHRSPEDINVLLDMSLDILDNDCSLDFLPTTYETECPPKKDNQLSALPIIHCSAGIGRTGCLLAILNGLSQMRLHSIPKDNQDGDELGRQNDVPEDAVKQSCRTINTERQVTVDILGIVCNLRLQRGGMVQNSEQYELIHRALCLYEQKYNKI